MTDGGKQTQTAAEAEKGKKVAGKKKRRKKQKAGVGKDVEEEEEIPQLVPIETPSKKSKLEVRSAQIGSTLTLQILHQPLILSLS